MRHYLVCLAAILFTGASALAATIDFSAAPLGFHSSYTEQGVTFTAVDLLGIDVFTPIPNGTAGILGNNSSPYSKLRADIAGGTSSVSIDLGDFNQDADLLTLEVFSASNVSLGSTSLLTATSDVSMHTLTISVPGIAYAIFGSETPSVSGSSVYADNFVFNAAAVPVPASAWAGLGLLLIVPIIRRRVLRAG